MGGIRRIRRRNDRDDHDGAADKRDEAASQPHDRRWSRRRRATEVGEGEAARGHQAVAGGRFQPCGSDRGTGQDGSGAKSVQVPSNGKSAASIRLITRWPSAQTAASSGTQ